MSSPDSLDRLTIKGFKSIRRLEDFHLTKRNILIGGNGAGKSNFIGFFRLLRSITNGSLNQYVDDNGGIDDLLFNGPKTTADMAFSTQFSGHEYSFTLRPVARNGVHIVDEIYRDLRAASAKPLEPQYDLLSAWRLDHFHDSSMTAGMRRYEIVQDSAYLREDAANIAPFLYRLKTQHPDAYAEIRNVVRLVIPFFDDFQLDLTAFGERQKINLAWHQNGSDYPMQPYHLSDGAIRFICLATALLQPDPPPTIIIDEPELGLHPFAIAMLAELIRIARTQVIIATQSPLLIDEFSVDDIVVVNRQDGASVFERLEEKDFNVWLQEYSVGELWKKNVISGRPVHE